MCSDNESVVRNRPDFGPDQVRCVCQIKKGLSYHERDGSVDTIFTVIREPFYRKQDFVKGWWIEVECSGSGLKHSLSLQDHNIFPYETGIWNSNWFAFTKKSRFLANSCCNHSCCNHHCRHCHCCHCGSDIKKGDTAKVLKRE